jgi:hypothetical protein
MTSFHERVPDTLGTVVRSLSIYLAAPVTVGDPGRTRVVFGSVLVLMLIGVGLAFAAIWLWRSTRRDPEVLAPLELMGRRSWRRADPVFQRRSLDEIRPPEAQPLSRMSPVPQTDAEFDRGPRLGDVEDLFEPVVTAVDEAVEAAADGSPEDENGEVNGELNGEVNGDGEVAGAAEDQRDDSEPAEFADTEEVSDHHLDLSLDAEPR